MSSLKPSGVKLRARHPTSLISSEVSAEDKPLFMASRKYQCSLSPISNGAPREAKRQSRSTCHGRVNTSRENIMCDTINDEIAEWPNVGQTGRASCWPPTLEWKRQGTRSIWQDERHTVSPGLQSIDHCPRPMQCFGEQRRAVTDSYLIGSSKVQDLAQVVAVQLLSACFTIPPDELSHYKTSAYHCFDSLDANDMKDSQMISSLRMHTEACHLLSFGHQARSTSPVNHGIGAYDGHSSSTGRDQSLECQPVDVKGSVKMAREQRIHRALHVAERLTVECSTQSHMGRCGTIDERPAAVAKAWNKGKRGTDAAQNPAASTVPTRSARSCPSSPKAVGFRLPSTAPLGLGAFYDQTLETSDGYQSKATPGRLRRLSLRTVIRSEPHHIYTQPVKELVAKWQNLRRRVGRSLSNSSPDAASGGLYLSSSVFQTPANPTPRQSSPESPIFSSDGKERRRQARERGEIHSSVEGSPRYSTPPFTLGTGGIDAIALLDETSRVAEIGSPVGSSTAISCPAGRSNTSPGLFPRMSLSTTLCCTPLNSETSSRASSPSVTVTSPIEFRSEYELPGGHSSTATKQAASTSSFSTRRHSQRRQRKSMLSEMYALEDTGAGQNTLNEVGSSLVSPREESGSETGEGIPGQNQAEVVNVATLMAEESSPITEPSLQDGNPFGAEVAERGSPRPNIVRTSTSGTQVFRPGKNGVEIDGLPIGPAATNWDDQRRKSKGKERSYL